MCIEKDDIYPTAIPEQHEIPKMLENTKILDKLEDNSPKIRFLRKRRVHVFAEVHKSSPEIPTLVNANGVHSSRIDNPAANIHVIYSNLLAVIYIQ